MKKEEIFNQLKSMGAPDHVLESVKYQLETQDEETHLFKEELDRIFSNTMKRSANAEIHEDGIALSITRILTEKLIEIFEQVHNNVKNHEHPECKCGEALHLCVLSSMEYISEFAKEILP